MLSRAARLLVLASFLVSTGMLASALQAVAWARMTVDFARRDTLSASLEKTFDGRHPCPICVSLKNTGERASVAAAPARGLPGFISPTAAPRAVRVALVWDVASSPPPSSARASRPASPPPKAALA